MADLSTNYMGFELRNPIVAGSCGLTNSVANIRRLEQAGVGAVVLKSLFEEQVAAEMADVERGASLYTHTEAADYALSGYSMEIGPSDYLRLIEEAKQATGVPIIASLNCVSARTWTRFARKVAAVGADGIELNITHVSGDPAQTAAEIERRYLDIVAAVRNEVNVPLAVKLGPHFTSLARVVREIALQGASAVVLFNRFYPFDIDIETLQLARGPRVSDPRELATPLRWIALLWGRVPCDLAGTTGTHDSAAVIKQILAGAGAVQIASVLYQNGMECVGEMLQGIETWMKAHDIEGCKQMRGALSQQLGHDPAAYERLQYIKNLVGIE